MLLNVDFACCPGHIMKWFFNIMEIFGGIGLCGRVSLLPQTEGGV